MELQDIKPDLMVHARSIEAGKQGEHGTRGIHVGTVDHLDGDRFIKLKKNDSEDGQHHWIPVDWVMDVDDKAVYLSKTATEFKQGLIDENPKFKH